MGLVVNLKEYSGPLDLLLQLIGSAKISIREIFVSEVTEQYLQIVRDAGLMDMEEASAFIQMAATLLLIKSRSLLPAEQDTQEENPEEQLIRQLEEYALFQQVAAQMQGFEQAAARVFTKLPDEFPLPPQSFELEGMTLNGLAAAFARVSARLFKDGGEEGVDKPALIVLEQHSLPQCMAGILKATRRDSPSFLSLLSDKPSRAEVVTLFLAVLELLKRGKIVAEQDAAGGDIRLCRPGKGEGRDGR